MIAWIRPSNWIYTLTLVAVAGLFAAPGGAWAQRAGASENVYKQALERVVRRREASKERRQRRRAKSKTRRESTRDRVRSVLTEQRSRIQSCEQGVDELTDELRDSTEQVSYLEGRIEELQRNNRRQRHMLARLLEKYEEETGSAPAFAGNILVHLEQNIDLGDRVSPVEPTAPEEPELPMPAPEPPEEDIPEGNPPSEEIPVDENENENEEEDTGIGAPVLADGDEQGVPDADSPGDPIEAAE